MAYDSMNDMFRLNCLPTRQLLIIVDKFYIPNFVSHKYIDIQNPVNNYLL